MKKQSKFLSVLLALVLVFSLAACAKDGSGSGGGSNSDIVTLKWVTIGNGMPDNYSAWQTKVNEYLEEKIGVHIDVEVIPWGDWETRRPTIVNTGSDYDIIFTNLNTFTNDVTIGAFADITDLLDTSGQELVKMIPEDYWDACRVNGQIYAVPTYKDSSQSEFMVWDKSLTDKLDIDPSKITTLEEMTPALEAMKEETGKPSFELYDTGATYLYYQYDNMSTGLPALGVHYNDKEAKVVYTFEQEDLYGYLSTFHEWYKSGVINSDAAVKPEEKAYRPAIIAQGWSGAVSSTWGPEVDIDEAVAYQWGPTVVSNDTVRGSLNCISANSKNQEKAMEFLQLVNTDVYLRDSLYYGLEGDNWDYTGEGDDKRVHRNNVNWSMAGYTQGTFFIVTPTDDVDFNQWDEVKELNENAEASVLLGFTLDVTKINNQLINCATIWERYKSELLTGTADPAVAVPAMLEELKAAGFDEIVAEAQVQVDAFMASK